MNILTYKLQLQLLVTTTCLVKWGEGVWVNPWWGGQGEFGGDNPGGGYRGSLGRQTLEARGMEQGAPWPWPPGFASPNSPGPILLGCLSKLTHFCSPRVDSDLSYYNSQVRAKLDDWHGYKPCLVTGLCVLCKYDSYHQVVGVNQILDKPTRYK